MKRLVLAAAAAGGAAFAARGIHRLVQSEVGIFRQRPSGATPMPERAKRDTLRGTRVVRACAVVVQAVEFRGDGYMNRVSRNVTLFALLPVAFLASGCNTTSASKPSETTTFPSTSEMTFNNRNFDRLVAHPDRYKGARVNVVGKVFSIQRDAQGMAFQMYADPLNDDWNTLVYAYSDTDVTKNGLRPCDRNSRREVQDAKRSWCDGNRPHRQCRRGEAVRHALSPIVRRPQRGLRPTGFPRLEYLSASVSSGNRGRRRAAVAATYPNVRRPVAVHVPWAELPRSAAHNVSTL
jgi:hypothetical protein